MDKQQKTGENVENIKFSLDTQLNFMFSTCSPVFCCLSARGLEVSLHFWQSWPTVHRLHNQIFFELTDGLGINDTFYSLSGTLVTTYE